LLQSSTQSFLILDPAKLMAIFYHLMYLAVVHLSSKVVGSDKFLLVFVSTVILRSGFRGDHDHIFMLYYSGSHATLIMPKSHRDRRSVIQSVSQSVSQSSYITVTCTESKLTCIKQTSFFNVPLDYFYEQLPRRGEQAVCA
jgi:hypothetical protein